VCSDTVVEIHRSISQGTNRKLKNGGYSGEVPNSEGTELALTRWRSWVGRDFLSTYLKEILGADSLEWLRYNEQFLRL
jgi:hypothetical protein